jgi:hypothetical protein
MVAKGKEQLSAAVAGTLHAGGEYSTVDVCDEAVVTSKSSMRFMGRAGFALSHCPLIRETAQLRWAMRICAICGSSWGSEGGVAGSLLRMLAIFLLVFFSKLFAFESFGE